MKIIKYLKKLYGNLRSTYDSVTGKRCRASIGDILLKQGNFPYSNQFLAISRLMDIEEFIYNADKTFPYQNLISRRRWGCEHLEEQGNESFKNLIASYKEIGYDDSSILELDKVGRLCNGTHRCGANLFFKIEEMTVRLSQLSYRQPKTIDEYLALGIPGDTLSKVIKRFNDVQDWLIETGNTFACKVSGFSNRQESIEFADALGYTCNILYTKHLRGGAIFQFSLEDPIYSCKNKTLVSLRCETLEKILHIRYPAYSIKVSKNCIEGKKMVKDLRNINSETV